MPDTNVDADTLAERDQLLVRRKLDVHEYHLMGEVGILHEDERVELIEGELIQMAPIGAPHSGRVNRLNRTLVMAFGDKAVVGVQNSVRLNNYNEPQPDFAVMRARADDYTESIPTPADLLLMIEVADSSVRYDRRIKAPLYAKHGVPEYWLLDIPGKIVEVHRDPGPDGYRRVTRHGPDETTGPEAAPDIQIALRPIIG